MITRLDCQMTDWLKFKAKLRIRSDSLLIIILITYQNLLQILILPLYQLCYSDQLILQSFLSLSCQVSHWEKYEEIIIHRFCVLLLISMHIFLPLVNTRFDRTVRKLFISDGIAIKKSCCE
jgi:hypothetical protein